MKAAKGHRIAGPEHAARGPVRPSLKDSEWVVGVGASAGGLEALEEFLAHLDLDHLCVLVVQHTLRDHASLLPHLLARNGRLCVLVAGDGVPLTTGSVLVSPPGVLLNLDGGILRHTPLGPSGAMQHPIDHCFTSLANTWGSRAAAVVLSGTGDDGSAGLGAIRAAGGVTFAQSPATAKFSGMPVSALKSGHVDFSWAPRDIAQKLAAMAQLPRSASSGGLGSEQPPPSLGLLIADIRQKMGTDLAQYKGATIGRRIQRRMLMCGLDSPEAYIRWARDNAEELQALHRDLLISVTSFFRDRQVFELLRQRIFVDLLAANAEKRSLRVWVPACATGEEAYSLAMLLLELLEGREASMRVQIFATDIDVDAVARARRGFFGGHIGQHVSAERLGRFFVARDGGYQVCRRLREMVVFSPHDLLHNAPFSRMDFVSCRNLLIYLRPPAQKKVLSTLQYALAPSGLLLLGTSESIGEAPQLFAVADARAKLYACKKARSRRQQVVPTQPSKVDAGEPLAQATLRRHSLWGLVARRLLEAYAPPGVVVDQHFDVLQFVGDVGPFLAPANGAASFNLLRLIRFELHVELKRAMTSALSQHKRAEATVTMPDEGGVRRIGIDVIPMVNPHDGQRCLLVLLISGVGVVPAAGLHTCSADVQMLSEELKITQEHLRGVIDETENARQGFKAANEELQSANEEMQSSNEELETAKEETQSANEELTTVNEELQARMRELGQINDDLHNFLSAAQTILITVDLDLFIRRWTDAAAHTLKLGPQDVGRSLSCLEKTLGCQQLARKAGAVIESLSIYRERVEHPSGSRQELIIGPYKTLDHAIRGAIVRLVPEATAAHVNIEVALAAVAQPLFAIDAGLRLCWGNAAFYRLGGISRRARAGGELSAIAPFRRLSPSTLARLRRAVVGTRRLRRLRVAVGGRAWTLEGSPLADSRRGPLLLLAVEVNDAA